MTWVVLALLVALFESLKDLIGKKLVAVTDEYFVAFALRAGSFLFLLPLLFVSPVPKLSPAYWWALLAGGFLNVVTTIMYMRAIKESDLSITIPMITTTPVFLLVASPILVGEWPTPAGLVGVIGVVVGAYMLNIGQARSGLLEPWRALLRERGPRLMLGVAAIWSLTANIDKIGVGASSPMFWAVTSVLSIALGTLPFLWRADRGPAPSGTRAWLLVAAFGLAGALVYAFQMMAITMTLVIYVIAIKRCSALLSVIWGGAILREEGLRQRLPGAAVMLAGAIWIMLQR